MNEHNLHTEMVSTSLLLGGETRFRLEWQPVRASRSRFVALKGRCSTYKLTGHKILVGASLPTSALGFSIIQPLAAVATTKDRHDMNSPWAQRSKVGQPSSLPLYLLDSVTTRAGSSLTRCFSPTTDLFSHKLKAARQAFWRPKLVTLARRSPLYRGAGGNSRCQSGSKWWTLTQPITLPLVVVSRIRQAHWVNYQSRGSHGS